MKDDDDYNVWRDTFGYHDEDLDGDVDWEDVDIADRHFKELQDVLYPKSTFDDEDDDNDGDNDEDLFEDDDNDEDLFEDDEEDDEWTDDEADDDDEWVNDDDEEDDDDEDVYHISIHFSLGASSRPNLTTVEPPQPADTKVAGDIKAASDIKAVNDTKVTNDTTPTVANTATIATAADESVSEVKPLEEAKSDSKTLEITTSAATNQPKNKAENTDPDKLFDLICRWVVGILATFAVIGFIFISTGNKTCQTIGTVFLVLPYIFVVLCFIGAVLGKIDKKWQKRQIFYNIKSIY
jgi:hypothetical protein